MMNFKHDSLEKNNAGGQTNGQSKIMMMIMMMMSLA